MNVSAETQTPAATALAVRGMTCAGCALTIERLLSWVPGVQRAIVDFDLGVAIVNGSAAPAELIAAVEAAGYGASAVDESAKRWNQQ